MGCFGWSYKRIAVHDYLSLLLLLLKLRQRCSWRTP